METIFETEHLVIRKFSENDAKALYANHLEEEVKQWIPNESYADLAEAKDAIGFFLDCVNQEHLPYVLAVEEKKTRELIGDTGINEVEGRIGEVEIGYTICKKASGNGYATELVKAMTEFSFSKFGVKVIYGRVMHGNQASVRVLEKNGYTYEKEEFGAEDDPYNKGMWIYKIALKELLESMYPELPAPKKKKCKQIVLDGAGDLKENYLKVLSALEDIENA